MVFPPRVSSLGIEATGVPFSAALTECSSLSRVFFFSEYYFPFSDLIELFIFLINPLYSLLPSRCTLPCSPFLTSRAPPRFSRWNQAFQGSPLILFRLEPLAQVGFRAKLLFLSPVLSPLPAFPSFRFGWPTPAGVATMRLSRSPLLLA